MAYKYFLYSSQELNFRKEMEEKMGKRFKLGIVFDKGKRLSFTQISSTPTSQYSDSKVVAEGEESTFRFTPPSSE